MALLVNSDSLLSMASKEGYAVPAYNINNLEWARFILEACQEDKSPVILAVTEKSISYFGGRISTPGALTPFFEPITPVF